MLVRPELNIEKSSDISSGVALEQHGGPAQRWSAARQQDRTINSNLLKSASHDGQNKLFHYRSDLKITLSRLANHLSVSMREHLFAEIDRLYDQDHFDVEYDNPIYAPSFKSFIRFLIYNKNCKLPSLGVSLEGHIVAGWGNDIQTLFLEFLSEDRVRLTSVEKRDQSTDEINCISGKTIFASKVIQKVTGNQVIFE